MAEKLNADELVALVQRVFTPGEGDRGLAIIVDMPDAEAADNAAWKERREMAADWAGLLSERKSEIGMERVNLLLYRNVRANNANLPATGTYHSQGPLPNNADEMRGGAVSFDQVFESHEILIAPTQFSATAPLKMAARQCGFRAATMPGFDRSMIPALRLDYKVIGERVDRLKAILDDAQKCDIRFDAAGRECALTLDLRHRGAHGAEDHLGPEEGGDRRRRRGLEDAPPRHAGAVDAVAWGKTLTQRREGAEGENEEGGEPNDERSTKHE